MAYKKNSNFIKQADIIKGFANHHRIAILYVIKQNPGITVEDVADELDVHYKTVASHIKRLAQASLITKRYQKTFVRHELTQQGSSILKFLRILE